MSSAPAMLTKPGASPHCGAKAVVALTDEALHGGRDADVLGQVEVVATGGAGRLGHAFVEVVRQAGDEGLDAVAAMA